MNKIIFAWLWILLFTSATHAQYYLTTTHSNPENTIETVIIFRFVQGDDMFYIPWGGNKDELIRLYSFIDEYHAEITSGKIPVYVDGYCVSLPDKQENIRTAFVRSNRVKSELIVNKELAEENFITNNYASDYNGRKDMVVVTIRMPVLKEEKQQQLQSIQETKTESIKEEIENKTQIVVSQNSKPVKEDQQKATFVTDAPQIKESNSLTVSEQQQDIIITGTTASRYVAIKTNLAAWAGTMLNIAADVQVSRHVSLELPVVWCPWHIGDCRSARVFALQPEARLWLSQPGEKHFLGVHTHAVWYNVRWKDDRYQDAGRPLFGAGLSYGYLLPLGNCWAGEFTLGAGYANMRYDTYYNIDNGARIDTRSHNYWGITRIGISVVYRFNPNK